MLFSAYIENQRIVSKLGGGFALDTTDMFSLVYGFDRQNADKYSIKKQENENMILVDFETSGQPGTFQVSDGLYSFLRLQSISNNPEEAICYYHSDHLGTTAYISDISGMPSQHIDYLPFGEVLLEEKAQSAWVTPYKFNCKELDAESSLYYYGARYFDPKTSVWLGVDPMSDKYPGLSPFVYCANNPIILIDPDGRDWFENEQTGSIYYNSNMGKNDAGKGAMKGEGWKHLGVNGMFEKEDGTGSDQQLVRDNNGSISHDAKNNSYNMELMLNGSGQAESFMDSQGYSKNPLVADVHSEETNRSFAEPHGPIWINDKQETTEKVYSWVYAKKGIKGDYSVIGNYKNPTRTPDISTNSWTENKWERRRYDYSSNPGKGIGTMGKALFELLKVLPNMKKMK